MRSMKKQETLRKITIDVTIMPLQMIVETCKYTVKFFFKSQYFYIKYFHFNFTSLFYYENEYVVPYISMEILS